MSLPPPGGGGGGFNAVDFCDRRGLRASEQGGVCARVCEATMPTHHRRSFVVVTVVVVVVSTTNAFTHPRTHPAHALLTRTTDGPASEV